jgi:hypothetical protein
MDMREDVTMSTSRKIRWMIEREEDTAEETGPRRRSREDRAEKKTEQPRETESRRQSQEENRAKKTIEPRRK